MTDRIVSPSIYKRVKTSRICVENQGTIFICLLLFVAVWFVFNKFEQFIITPPLSHVVDFLEPPPTKHLKFYNPLPQLLAQKPQPTRFNTFKHFTILLRMSMLRKFIVYYQKTFVTRTTACIFPSTSPHRL